MENISTDKLTVGAREKVRFTKETFDAARVTDGHGVAMISLGGPEMEVTFKVHYNTEVDQQILADCGNINCSVHLELVDPNNVPQLKVPAGPIKTKKRKISFL